MDIWNENWTFSLLATVTDVITVEVSSGPETQRVPDLPGKQTVDQSTTNLKIAGLPIVVPAPVDSLLPSGQVGATDLPQEQIFRSARRSRRGN